jgi:coenzyme F420-0:L-glutamate ligase / coenzyme F420-1:gamma-L-glutamate ligase
MPTSADELHTFLRTRRSIRRFKPDPVPAEVIEKILATAGYAPSAHNLQPWRFVVITTLKVKKELGKVLTNALRADMLSEGANETDIERRVATSLCRLDEAPVIVMSCRDVTAVHTDVPEEVTMGIQSTALAGLQLLLAVHAEGLGGNWICWPLYAQDETRKALGLPEVWEPQAMYFIGYPAENPLPKEKRISNTIIQK